MPIPSMFTLHFGHDFDGPVYAPPSDTRAGEIFAGPKKLLQWLEHQLGLGGYPENTDYIRIELYRQSLAQHLADCGQEPLFSEPPFYERSFHADRFATAAALLTWRDELLMAGEGLFSAPAGDLPPRLSTLWAVESIFAKKLADPDTATQAAGFADRFVQVLRALKSRSLPLQRVRLYEPEELQPGFVKSFIQIVANQNITVEVAEIPCAAPANTHLGAWQRQLRDTSPAIKAAPENAGSIWIIRARRDSDAATFLAQLLRKNPALRPLFLVPEMDLLPERALALEGFPAMGMLSASLARPSLQVLKLAPVFLWEPVDVFKIMEFVTLPVKPLNSELASEIARVLAAKPGLFSDSWFAAVYGYLEQAEVPDSAREQYEFWFGRRRYRANGSAPKRDAITLYAYLQEWALDQFDDGGANPSMLVLAEQARRIKELLEALPEPRITFLELERIVRTVYEPSPVQFAPAEIGRFGFVHQPGAVADCIDTLVWWNCLYADDTPAPDKWRPDERDALEKRGVSLRTPRQESRLNLIRRIRPVLQTAQRLILVIPEQANGAEAVPSLLLGDLEALFPDKKAFTFCLEDQYDRARLERSAALPVTEQIPVQSPGRVRPTLPVARADLLAESEYETPTNLESLFYYPHRWFFKQKLRLFPSGILSVTGDTTLLGNLAHRFFEKLLRENTTDFDRKMVQEWVDDQANQLLPSEGATLLLYGREPERNLFLQRVKNAAWSLLSMLRSNGWEVAHTEYDLEGEICGAPVRGKADLVLRRNGEMAIVDLKWSGAKRRKELIQNGEDLQLVLYAKLLPPPDKWPHTAYFILEEGKMIARNNAAFKEAIVAGRNGDDHADACAAIFEKMEKTFLWRADQIRRGILELRTARTASELEALYEGQLLDLLEMKTEDAKWDDYRVLLGHT